MKLSHFSRKVTLMSVILLSSAATAGGFISLKNSPLESFMAQRADAATTSNSYSVSGTVGSFTILKSPTMVGTGNSTSGFVANAKENDASAPKMTSGSGVVSAAGTYSGSSVAISAGSNKGTYAANWGSAPSLVTTGAYVVSGLSVGSSFDKTWSNIGTLNGKALNVTMTFIVTALQNPSGTNNYIAVSNNLNTFVTSNNLNGKFQVHYTYADGTPLSLSDMNQLAFLGGSLTPSTEYMTTADAADVLLSSNASVPTAVKGATTANASSLGLASGLTTVFYSPTNSYTVSDTDFNSYAYAYGASFLNFSTATPTFYFGNWTASSGKISAQGANHILFATETSPITVSKLLTAVGDSYYTTVTPSTDAVLKNTVNPSQLNDNSSATITKATASVVSGPDGQTYPAGSVTVDDAGNVTVDHSILSKPGIYTFSVTYTDSTGAIVTAYDNISVAIGTNSLTPLATPVTVKNTNVPTGTPKISVKGPDGASVTASDVTLNQSDADSLVTLAGQNTPGIYTIDLTYPNGVVVEDYISVVEGDSTTVGTNQLATLQNNVQEIIDQNTTDGGNVIQNPVLDLSAGVVGTISAPTGVTVDPALVSVNADGSVTLNGQPTPGVYTIPVTYTETYTDSSDKQVTLTVTINDVVTVVENKIPGFEVSTAQGSAVTGTNDLSNVNLGLLDAQGPKQQSVELLSATQHDANKTPITTASAADFTLNGSLLAPWDYGGVTASDQLAPGDYTIKVTYVGQDGIQSTVNDIVHVYPKPTLSSQDTKMMVGDDFTDKAAFTEGMDSLGQAIDYDEAIQNGDLLVTDDVDTSKAGDYTVTFTYTDPTTKQKVTSTATVTVVDNTAISSKATDAILEGTDFAPADDYLASTNADKTAGSLTNTNSAKVAVVITDAQDKLVWSGSADAIVPASKLPAGNYTVTYKVTDTTGSTKSSTTALKVIALDRTDLVSKATDTVPAGIYKPSGDYLSSQNTDGSSGSLTATNNQPVQVTITDKNGQVIDQGPADRTVTLTGGTYTVVYTVKNADGNAVSSTTSLTVTDNTSISSKATDTIIAGIYQPSKDYVTSTNADGTGATFANTNGNSVKVSLTDKSGNVVTPNADGTYTLAGGSYSEIYTVTDSNGNPHSATTIVSVQDLTTLHTQSTFTTDAPALNQSTVPFDPAAAFETSTNADGSDGTLANTNGASVTVTVTGKNGNLVSPASDGTYPLLPDENYTVTYTTHNASGQAVSTTTEVNVPTAPVDESTLDSRDTDQISVGTYHPLTDLTTVKNADGTDGKGNLKLNNGPIHVEITDENNKLIWQADLTADSSVNLTGGTYVVTYTGKDSLNNPLVTTSSLTVTDQTALISKPVNNSLKANQTYQPASDLVTDKNADGSDGSLDLTNGNPVKVTITDEKGQPVRENADGTYTLAGGSYTSTYTSSDSNGQPVVTTTLINVSDLTSIMTKGTDQITDGNDFIANIDFVSSTNADGSTGNLSSTNENPVTLNVVDKTGKSIWTGKASDKIPASKLPTGDYTITYQVKNSNGQIVSSTTNLTVQAKNHPAAPSAPTVDHTTLTSQAKDQITDGNPYTPSIDLTKATDQAGNKVPDSDISVTITDQTGKLIWNGKANDTVSAGRLTSGSYTVTYTYKAKTATTSLSVVAKKQPTAKPTERPASAPTQPTSEASNNDLPQTSDSTGYLAALIGTFALFGAGLLEALKRLRR
ncbi:beta strand repeat-containing protein [Lactococcus kimchii]|uniref:beta strand repeat-containing protein n=1 Tax=Lactococcus sp. S-13 TaxID=2507158 RepID=UPI001022F9BF|nr:bacterial Ig-like domain-containing protein [Lactococcus sp. S-13]RZI48358.1 hypothetical protein EQJ87_02215 [Lactococcus sp. S-13]